MAGRKDSMDIEEMTNYEIIDEMEELLKKYSKKPEKSEYKRDIIKYLQKAKVILPVDTKFDTAAMSGDEISNIILKPDVVKDPDKKRLIPIFTSLEQIPEEYADHFSLIKVRSRICYNMMNEREDIDGLVINPFSKSMPLMKKNQGRSQVKETQPAYDFMIVHNGKKYVISKWPFTIGRSGTDIEIDESYISKVHAVLAYKNGKYILADNASTNGTTVNGIKLKPKVPVVLHNGYKIVIADEEEFVVYINE